MKEELFIFRVPSGKSFKIIDNNGLFEIWAQQVNGEFVYIESSQDMEGVKTFLKSKGYNGQ